MCICMSSDCEGSGINALSLVVLSTLSEETQLICRDYDAATLRLQVVATQPTRLNGRA